MNTDYLELKAEIAAKYAELSQHISRLEALISGDDGDEDHGSAQLREVRPE